MGARAIVLFAHGARDPQWAEPFQKIQARVAAALADVPVELAFLELMSPDLLAAVTTLVDRGAKEITIVPLFMAQGGHLKHDIPVLLEKLRAAHVNVVLRLTPPIGEVDAILQEISNWIVAIHPR